MVEIHSEDDVMKFAETCKGGLVATIRSAEAAQIPPYIIIGAAVATLVELFARYGEPALLPQVLRDQADHFERMHALDTAAAGRKVN